MKARNIKLHPSISRVKKMESSDQYTSKKPWSGNTRYSHKNLMGTCMVSNTLKTELVTMYPKEGVSKEGSVDDSVTLS